MNVRVSVNICNNLGAMCFYIGWEFIREEVPCKTFDFYHSINIPSITQKFGMVLSIHDNGSIEFVGHWCGGGDVNKTANVERFTSHLFESKVSKLNLDNSEFRMVDSIIQSSKAKSTLVFSLDISHSHSNTTYGSNVETVRLLSENSKVECALELWLSELVLSHAEFAVLQI